MNIIKASTEKVKKVINRHGKGILTLLAFCALLGTAEMSFAQSGLKIILAAVLGIALVFVIYSLATNNPHAKEYLLGWIIAVVVIMVAFLII